VERDGRRPGVRAVTGEERAMPGEASGRSGVAARRGWRQVALATFAAALASAAPVLAGVVVPISEAEGGASGDTPILGAYASHLSPDGRYVLFQGESPDYHPSAPDGNGANDLVLWDGQTDTATLISIDAGGAAAGDGPSWFQEATPDGRWVIFASAASDLVAGISDTNATDDAFLWDRDSGTTWLISESATGGATGDQYSYPYFISLDGRYVLVQSRASDLVSGVTDTNNQDDLFLWDRDTGTTALISESSAGGATGNNYSYAHSMSSDGRYVLFRSRASDLLSGVTDTNGQDDLFLWDRNTGTTALISESSAGGATGNNYSYAHSMSSDGRYVLFYSRASDLVAGVTDTNGTEDLFLWDRDTGTKALISESAAGGATADSNTYPHSMTSDGRWVLFWSRATNLVSGVTDANNWEDLFLWDRDTGTKLLISESGTGGTTGNDYSYAHSMTADGRYVLFQSRASDLVAGVTDTNGTEDLFFWDRDTGTTQLISESGSGGATGNQHSSAHSMTSDGRWVLFWSSASDLVSGVTDTNGTQDLFLWDRDTGTKVLISESSSGGATGNNYSQPHSTTPDGRYVLFTSYASDLVPGATDTNGTQDLFVWDRDTGTKVLISESSSGGATGDSSSSAHTMTSDGRYVLFQSRASDLVSGVADTNDRDDLFLWDRLDGSTKLVDRRRSSASMMGLSDSQFRAASEDGRYVLFMSYASNLVADVIDGNGTWDVYQWDRVTQSTSLVSEAASGGATGNQYSEPHSMSSDGRYVLFRSYASDLVTGVTDSNSQEDLFLWDRDTGTTLLISESGSGGATGNNASYPHSMTSDGRYVLFYSYASDLVAGVTDTNGTWDLFLWDRDAGTTVLISESGSGGATGNQNSYPNSMTTDGRYVLFYSSASDLVSGVTDTNGTQDLFLWDRDTGTTLLISESSSGGATGNGGSSAHSMTLDGRYVLFGSLASDLVSGVTDANGTRDLFLWDRDTGTTLLISESSSGGATGNHVSSEHSMTSDGRYVLFRSRASDLVSGVTDTNNQDDLFLWDRDSGTTSLISESSSGVATGNLSSQAHSMASDGRYVLFRSVATDLVSGVTDTNATADHRVVVGGRDGEPVLRGAFDDVRWPLRAVPERRVGSGFGSDGHERDARPLPLGPGRGDDAVDQRVVVGGRDGLRRLVASFDDAGRGVRALRELGLGSRRGADRSERQRRRLPLEPDERASRAALPRPERRGQDGESLLLSRFHRPDRRGGRLLELRLRPDHELRPAVDPEPLPAHRGERRGGAGRRGRGALRAGRRGQLVRPRRLGLVGRQRRSRGVGLGPRRRRRVRRRVGGDAARLLRRRRHDRDRPAGDRRDRAHRRGRGAGRGGQRRAERRRRARRGGRRGHALPAGGELRRPGHGRHPHGDDRLGGRLAGRSGRGERRRGRGDSPLRRPRPLHGDSYRHRRRRRRRQ